MTALFATADTIGSSTGGGLVSFHEAEALRSLGMDSVTLSRDDLNPNRYSMPDSPFLFDYLALDAVFRRFGSGREQPRLAHFYSGTFTHTVRYLKSRGVPVTYTIAAHGRRESIREFEASGIEYPFVHVKEPHIWELYTEGVRHADIVIAPSWASATALATEGCRRVEVIPHGTDLPAEVPPLPESFSVGYLGQPGPDKGLPYLVRAWGSLGVEDSTLLLAGSGSEQLSPVVTANANQGRFELLGRVAQAGDLYRRISVYVQPSVTEGFGIEILEAMAHGRPVVASEGAGAAELVTPGKDGFVVPRRDPAAIAKHLSWFKQHPEKIAEMGQRAREKAKSYTWQSVRKKYVELWQGLLP